MLFYVMMFLTMTLCGSQVLSSGYPGANSRNLLGHINKDISEKKPEMMIILVGTNDSLNSRNPVTLTEYGNNLKKIIKKLKDKNIDIILMTIPPCYPPYLLKYHRASFFKLASPIDKIKAFNKVIKKVAKAEKVLMVDIYSIFDSKGNVGSEKSSWICNKLNSHREDGVHPTPEGYKNIAKLLFETIKKHKLKPKVILCFGDSITYGVYVEGAGKASGQTYPGQLFKLLKNY